MSAQPDILQQLTEEIAKGPGDRAPTMGLIKKVNYTHDAMIDIILANPAISQNDLATHFGYTASWVSNIMASDAFQARLAMRRAEIVDPSITATVEERIKGLALRSMEVLQEKLAKPSHQVPDNLALRTLELSTKAAGYGAKVPGGAQLPGVSSLEDLGDRLLRLQRSVRRNADGSVQATETVEIRQDDSDGDVQRPRSEIREPIEGAVCSDGSGTGKTTG